MVKVHFFGHAFFKIAFSKCNVLIDPFINYSGETERLVPCHPKAKKLKNIDVILVTHEHFDHFDKEAIEGFCAKDNCFVVAHESVLNELNIEKNLKRPILKGQTLNIKGVEVKAVSVHHPHSFYPLGFCLTGDGVSLLHAGDTKLIPFFNEFKCNIAMFPIGGEYTMDLVDAVKAVKTVKPDVAIPMHYDTFESIKASSEEFREKIEKSILKTQAVILKPGASFDYLP